MAGGDLVKRVMMKIVADDGDAEAKLDKITAKADEFARKHPEMTAKVNIAAASAKLAVLRKELKDTGKQSDDTSFSFKKLGAALAELAGGVGFGQGLKDMSMFQKVLLGLNLATGLGEPLIAGLTVAVGGLSSGLVAAGAGLGVFGAVAKGVYSQVSTQISAYNAAQLASMSATSKAAKTTDLLKMKNAFNGLTGSQKEFARSIVGAQSAWQNFVTKATPGVASLAKSGFALLPKIFASMTPFLKPVESALHGIITEVSHGLSSSGFKSFIDMLAKNTGPAITKIAAAIGHVVVGIGGILKAFMPVSHSILSGLDDITGKFAKWGTTLSGHSGFQSLMKMFRSETPLAMNALKSLAGIIKTVVSQMTGMSTFGNSKMLLQLAVPILKLADALLKAHPELVWLVLYLKLAADGGKKLHNAFTGISDALTGLKKGRQYISDFASGFGDAEKAADDATGAAGSMGGKFSSVFSSIKSMAVSAMQKLGLMTAATEEQAVATEAEAAAQEEADVAMDANPIGLIIIAVVALAAAIYEVVRHWKDFKKWGEEAWHAIKDVTVSVWHDIDNDVFHPIQRAIDDVIGFFERLWHDVVRDFDSLKDGVVQRGEAVINWFKQLPGRIVNGLSRLGKDLWNAAVNAVMGFINGAKSMLGEVLHIGASIGSSLLHGAESLLGIHSPSTEMRKRGQMAAKGFELGVLDGIPGVSSATAKMTQSVYGAAASARAGSSYGSSSGTPANTLTIQLRGSGTGLDHLFMTWLENSIRGQGGSVGVLRQKVKFA